MSKTNHLTVAKCKFLLNYDINAVPFETVASGWMIPSALDHLIFSINFQSDCIKSAKKTVANLHVSSIVVIIVMKQSNQMLLNSNECFSFGDLTTKMMAFCPYCDM